MFDCEIFTKGTKQTKIEIENKKSLLKISGFYFQKDMLELESVSVLVHIVKSIDE